MTKIVIGLILFFAALWGGAFVMHMINTLHWARMPVFMTACIAAIGGIYLVAHGIAYDLK